MIIDRDGAQHVRFNRTWKTLPVLGGDVVVHSNPAGQWVAPSAAARAVTPASSAIRVTALEAKQSLAARYPAGASVWTPERVVDALAGPPVMAWRATVSGVRGDQTRSRTCSPSTARAGRSPTSVTT